MGAGRHVQFTVRATGQVAANPAAGMYLYGHTLYKGAAPQSAWKSFSLLKADEL